MVNILDFELLNFTKLVKKSHGGVVSASPNDTRGGGQKMAQKYHKLIEWTHKKVLILSHFTQCNFYDCRRLVFAEKLDLFSLKIIIF